MSATEGARALARAEVTRSIKEVARRHLTEHGAAALSLRAVAREVGMVSSAVYRYFPSRDDLLTALIVDAYDDLGAAVEQAARRRRTDPARDRWLAASRAVRRWARAHPHEYALIYGSPVPGYAAPLDTVVPAARAGLALLGIVADAWAAGELTPAPPIGATGARLTAEADRLAAAAGLHLPGDAVIGALIAWTQLLGLVSFELYGHLVNGIEPASLLFDEAVERMADLVGFAAGATG